MSFYEALSPYYDRIFPLNQLACSFLSSYFHNGEAVLDIGAGTGSMAIALADKGLQVTALEPEETMAEQIRLKAVSSGLNIAVNTTSMEEIDLLQEHYDGIYCIGNTIAHLQNLGEIEGFLSKCYKKLNQNGKLILQTVNYDHVLSNQHFSFPVIQKEDFIFTREYEKKDEKILFTTKLAASEDSIINTVPLYPITSQQLIPLLNKVGFQTVYLYGNFKRDDYSMNAQALIIVAFGTKG
ncbi:class I SAM-dependent methyltransferase [Bacillus sp. Bva_UNVM-123]|uniref:class I SAM-dependent methyltransferase n=1 Tax=Bacillus sp. Bva_UNVM-123 TaxID=2829798 RepID=UPI00391F4EA7